MTAFWPRTDPLGCRLFAAAFSIAPLSRVGDIGAVRRWRDRASYDELAPFAALDPPTAGQPAFRNDAAITCAEPVNS
jgi:hypothetical protein